MRLGRWAVLVAAASLALGAAVEACGPPACDFAECDHGDMGKNKEGALRWCVKTKLGGYTVETRQCPKGTLCNPDQQTCDKTPSTSTGAGSSSSGSATGASSGSATGASTGAAGGK